MNKDDYHGEGEIKELEERLAKALAERDAWGLTHQKDVAKYEDLEAKIRIFFEAAEYRNIDDIMSANPAGWEALGRFTAILTKALNSKLKTSEFQNKQMSNLMQEFVDRVDKGELARRAKGNFLRVHRVVLAVIDGYPDVLEREAGHGAAFQRLAHAFLHRRDELRRNRAADDLVLELEA